MFCIERTKLLSADETLKLMRKRYPTIPNTLEETIGSHNEAYLLDYIADQNDLGWTATCVRESRIKLEDRLNRYL